MGYKKSLSMVQGKKWKERMCHKVGICWTNDVTADIGRLTAGK